jgi:acyl-homoserine-lactone acylase
MSQLRGGAAGVAVLLIAACTSGSQQSSTTVSPAPVTTVLESFVEPSTPKTAAPEPTLKYSAVVRRTSDGVPHITADDFGSLGFGHGYAYAEDRACTLLDQVVMVRGERSKYFGVGESLENLNSDFTYRSLNLVAEAEARWSVMSEDVSDLVDGYVDGFNHALLSDAADDSWCADEPWVAPITRSDYLALVSDVLGLASIRNFIDAVATAQPPSAAVPADAEGVELQPAPGASNGWAFGAENSSTGGGMLLANPHFPWEGELRFYEVHLTIPGELDVYGAALNGFPGVQIGFNQDIAWTHTVSAGHRFTGYRYDVDPTDPTRYIVDGESRAMTSKEIVVDVLADDGTVGTATRTLWSTEHGPVVVLGPLGWTTEQVLSIRDATAELSTTLDQFLAMDRASSMDEFQAAHDEHQGIPWVNTIATSADGRAWMADTAATPNLSPDAITAWNAEVAAGGLLGLAYNDFGLVLLDGSDSLFNWVDAPDAPAPGLVPFAQLPQIERTDWVFNANDPYWFANPAEVVDRNAVSPLHGDPNSAISPRTRMNALLLGESDSTWGVPEIEEAIFSNRSMTAEQLRPSVVGACGAIPVVPIDGVDVDLTAACDVLESWSGRYDLDARGAIVWREFLAQWEFDDLTTAGALFADSFIPDTPMAAPVVVGAEPMLLAVALGQAVMNLQQAGIPIDAPLGDWQWEVRSSERIPIHGSTGRDTANAVGCCSGSSTRQPIGDVGESIEGSALRSLPGYPISDGASFVMALQFAPDGPIAEGFLTYGNPDDPTDPAALQGFRDFSTRTWRSFAFTDEAIDSDPGVKATSLGMVE